MFIGGVISSLFTMVAVIVAPVTVSLFFSLSLSLGRFARPAHIWEAWINKYDQRSRASNGCLCRFLHVRTGLPDSLQDYRNGLICIDGYQAKNPWKRLREKSRHPATCTAACSHILHRHSSLFEVNRFRIREKLSFATIYQAPPRRAGVGRHRPSKFQDKLEYNTLGCG